MISSIRGQLDESVPAGGGLEGGPGCPIWIITSLILSSPPPVTVQDKKRNPSSLKLYLIITNYLYVLVCNFVTQWCFTTFSNKCLTCSHLTCPPVSQGRPVSGLQVEPQQLWIPPDRIGFGTVATGGQQHSLTVLSCSPFFLLRLILFFSFIRLSFSYHL